MPKNKVLQIEQKSKDSMLTAIVRVYGSKGSTVQIHVVATQDFGATAVGGKTVTIDPDLDYSVPLIPDPSSNLDHVASKSGFRPNVAINAIALTINTWTVALNNKTPPEGNLSPPNPKKPTLWQVSGNYKLRPLA